LIKKRKKNGRDSAEEIKEKGLNNELPIMKS